MQNLLFAQNNPKQILKPVSYDSLFIDSLLNDTLHLSDTLLSQGKLPNSAIFNSQYYIYLKKADNAFKFGFYKRALRFYKLAQTYNSQSKYISDKIQYIGNHKPKLSQLIFSFNFDKPDIVVKSLTYLVIYFIISMVVLLVIIIGNRTRLERQEKRKQKYREVYQELLVDFLFSENKADKPLEKFLRKNLNNNFSRKLLINQMIDLSINLTGDAKEKLRNLYFDLGLDEISVNKVNSSKWYRKIKGFREVAFMDITSSNDELTRSLLSKNDLVRMESQLALVRLNHQNPFEFLDYLEKPFTLWEQLTIYETIMFHNISIPLFDRWLFSKNKSVVMFAIRMIDIFKQKEAYPNLFWMLVNEDSEIRHQTIVVIGNLRIKDALPNLKRLYKTENYLNCLAIIKAMAKMPDESMLGFLKLVLDKEDDVQLQIEAAMAINNMGEIGRNTLEKLLNSDYKNYKIIIKHVIDKRIN